MTTERHNRLNAAILKATTLFGGLQGAQIVCSLVRAKLVAVWLGPVGTGLFGIFNSAVEMLQSATQLGIRQSAVRDLAAASDEELPVTVAVVRRWAFWLALLGATVTLLLSSFLSEISFGDTSMWWAFAWLSAVVFLGAINMGEGAVFQGLRRFRKLAVCTLAGSVGGLAVSVPMFYFWRINSIIPSIIAYAVCTWLAMGLYRERVPRPAAAVTAARAFALGKGFMMLGIYLTVAGLVANGISYIFLAYLNNFGSDGTTTGTEAAGLYQAGFTLVNRYVGLVFTALSMEYYPRLTAIARSGRRLSAYVANQMVITLGLLVPVVALFIGAAPWLVRLFYDSEYLMAVPFIVWAAAGTVFRGIAWCMSFVLLAKGDGRTLMVCDILSGAIALTLNIAGYRLGGFTGLGVAYLLWYLAYTAIIGYVYSRRYRLTLSRAIAPLLIYSVAATVASGLLASLLTPVAALPVAAASCLVSARILRRKLR